MPKGSKICNFCFAFIFCELWNNNMAADRNLYIVFHFIAITVPIRNTKYSIEIACEVACICYTHNSFCVLKFVRNSVRSWSTVTLSIRRGVVLSLTDLSNKRNRELSPLSLYTNTAQKAGPSLFQMPACALIPSKSSFAWSTNIRRRYPYPYHTLRQGYTAVTWEPNWAT